MAEDDKRLTAEPAPLPRHERAWRHPSEIGQHRRALARRPAPPLSPIVTSLCGALGLVVIIALVAFIVPPNGRRESVRQVRNAVAQRASGSVAADSRPGIFSADGKRFLLAIADPSGTRRLFATSGKAPGLVITAAGDRVILSPVRRDDVDGITILEASGDFFGDGSKDQSSPASRSATAPTPGTSVIVRGLADVDGVIGISVNSDTRHYVPLAGDVLTADIAEAAPVEDDEGRLLGLFTQRNGARGYIPLSVIEELASRP